MTSHSTTRTVNQYLLAFDMVYFNVIYLLSFFTIFAGTFQVSNSDRSFTINYEKNSFYMDGKPFRYVSGSVHYFRIPHEYWRDRLRKVRAAGLNAVSTYVSWSQHEPFKGQYNFTGNLNIKKFIKIAQEEGLYVILRPGPYICAEVDFGGLPYWLLKYNNIELRTNDMDYIKNVQLWIDLLFKKLSSLFYGNGGPIILVQVENEYGSYYACDRNHTVWLRDLFKKHVKNDAVLFTTDGVGDSFLRCGKVPDVYATVDFGADMNVEEAFRVQRKYEPRGPLINSEYYPGWLTHWGEKMARKETEPIVRTLTKMLDMGANVNFYMFHGGTNFGFTAGANRFHKYESDITSYDYDAPISEAGDITDKYREIQKVVFAYLGSNNIFVNSSSKGQPTEVLLQKVATLLSPTVRKEMGVLSRSEAPKTFEELDISMGYVLYETILPENLNNTPLVIRKFSDFASVYVNEIFIGNLIREFNNNTIQIKNVKNGDILSVLVENLGRINFGNYLADRKGILSSVTMGLKELVGWNMTAFNFTNLDVIEECARFAKEGCDTGKGFSFYYQSFVLPARNVTTEHELDVFFDTRTLTKGLIFINGFNLGRYWSQRGPQYTLYVPGVYLNSYPNKNKIIIMDENINTNSVKLKITNKPIFRY